MDHPFAQTIEKQKESSLNDLGLTSTDHVFHEDIVITVPLGPGVKKNNNYLSIESGPFSVCVCGGGSLYYVLYIFLITFVHNATVNAKPLNPPILRKSTQT